MNCKTFKPKNSEGSQHTENKTVNLTSTVGPLEGTIFVGAQLTPLWTGREPEGSHGSARTAWLERADVACVVVGVLTTRAALSCDSHFRQNHGPVGTWTMP